MELKNQRVDWPVEDSLVELTQLARTAGIEVLGSTVQRLEEPNPSTYIGSGKVEEVQAWQRQLGCDAVIFDDELRPRQQRNLEEKLDIKVVDRTALILDIFARHARTREGRLQVELAQYEYRLPRLTRMWTHLSRQAVGGVGLRGPGETQLETDRRDIGRRMAQLKRQLEAVRTHRRQYRRRRQKAGIPVVAIVGYTNAGKSTLLNALSGADVLVDDRLFATLDPTTRRVTLPDGKPCLFTDTVGFIQKLPTQLVAAFRATLEEINEADLLVHILDMTHHNVHQQSSTVEKVLRELGAHDKPVITALNKIDLLRDRVVEDLGPGTGPRPPTDELQIAELAVEMASAYANCVAISATEQLGLERLLERVQDTLTAGLVRLTVLLPYASDGLVNLIHARGIVEHEEYTQEGVTIRGRVPHSLADVFRPYVLNGTLP